jgi:hypothetical protein
MSGLDVTNCGLDHSGETEHLSKTAGVCFAGAETSAGSCKRCLVGTVIPRLPQADHPPAIFFVDAEVGT